MSKKPHAYMEIVEGERSGKFIIFKIVAGGHLATRLDETVYDSKVDAEAFLSEKAPQWPVFYSKNSSF